MGIWCDSCPVMVTYIRDSERFRPYTQESPGLQGIIASNHQTTFGKICNQVQKALCDHRLKNGPRSCWCKSLMMRKSHRNKVRNGRAERWEQCGPTTGAHRARSLTRSDFRSRVQGKHRGASKMAVLSHVCFHTGNTTLTALSRTGRWQAAGATVQRAVAETCPVDDFRGASMWTQTDDRILKDTTGLHGRKEEENFFKQNKLSNAVPFLTLSLVNGTS